jgi:hypothetical protein
MLANTGYIVNLTENGVLPGSMRGRIIHPT